MMGIGGAMMLWDRAQAKTFRSSWLSPADRDVVESHVQAFPTIWTPSREYYDMVDGITRNTAYAKAHGLQLTRCWL